MTLSEMVDACLRWDRIAKERDDREARKSIWRVLDALRGAPLSDRAKVWLITLDQTETVKAMRVYLGIDDSPMWERRSA